MICVIDSMQHVQGRASSLIAKWLNGPWIPFGAMDPIRNKRRNGKVPTARKVPFCKNFLYIWNLPMDVLSQYQYTDMEQSIAQYALCKCEIQWMFCIFSFFSYFCLRFLFFPILIFFSFFCCLREGDIPQSHLGKYRVCGTVWIECMNSTSK